MQQKLNCTTSSQYKPWNAFKKVFKLKLKFFNILELRIDVMKLHKSEIREENCCFELCLKPCWLGVYFWQSKALIVPYSFFSSTFFFFFFIFIPIASPPRPIVPATWHEHSFLDSHSARRRTALQLPAKTPYLRLAACRQDGGVRWGGVGV